MGDRLHRHRGFEALPHQREHPLAELGQMGEPALAPQQLAAELDLEAPDGSGQRRLRDVAARRPWVKFSVSLSARK
jgi:hypothetical protein